MRSLANRSAASRVLFALAALAMSAGAASATDRHHVKQPAKANQYYGVYQSPVQSLPLDQADQIQFKRAGTIGREGLGESPRHPEGPGNVSD